MTIELLVQEAMLAALTEVEGTNGVFLDRPTRASTPYMVVGELQSSDWGAKGAAGRELRLIVHVHDAGESWTRTVQLQGAAAQAIEGLPRQIGGWSVGSVVMNRARTVRDGTRGWRGTVEFRVRALLLD